MEKKGTILMQKYEIGRLLGQGNFAKVYYGRNLKTGQSVAVKIIDKDKVMKVGLIDQIKREISVMRLVKHPNVVQLYEVMASKTKIYFAMEYVKGGELFNKVAKGRINEDVARKYFQQLIAAVDFCHSRGVYHRDLKPENLLLDESDNLKISDFGLSALSESRRQDGLLHTTCGTPAYVAPEVIGQGGYDGEKADVWSCGVILFVLLAGYLPFDDPNLMVMYRKISKGEYKCAHWFPPEVKKLLSKIINPNPVTRITLEKIMENSWFKKGFKQYEPATPTLDIEYSPRSVLDFQGLVSGECSTHKKSTDHTIKPTCLNAFDIVSRLPGFDLSSLFQKDVDHKSETRFTIKKPASTIVSKFEELAMMEKFTITKEDGTVKLQRCDEGRKGKLAMDAEIFELTPLIHMVEVKKRSGDTFEYMKFCDQELKSSLKDILWTWEGCEQPLQQQQEQEQED